MMIALILVGFMMMTLGVALLFLGEVPFLAGKRISAWRSRLIGLVQMSFLPLALAAWKGVQWLFGPDVLEPLAVTYSLLGFCWFVTIALLFRVMFPKRAPRGAKGKSRASAGDDPFPASADEDVPAAEPFGFAEQEAEPAPGKPMKNAPAPKGKAAAKPTAKPGAKRTPAPPTEEDNPFNFS